MKRKMIGFFTAFLMVLALAACGSGEETTITGMVVSVDGTVISLMEMSGNMGGGMNFGGGERPQRPEGMEGFEGFGDFDPEDFAGGFPQFGGGEMPEMPQGMEPPEGMTVPDFGGMGFGSFSGEGETKTVDVGDAHISVEIDGGKASGSMSDIKAGVFVTVTVNGKGQVTNVLVSSGSSFRG